MLRGLTYFWRISLAVAAAAAINTAVLTGALLVGDSVRGSLRDLTLDRLGAIDQVVLSERFFRERLADDLADVEGFAEELDAGVPVILVRGSAVHADSGARASQVAVLGIDDRFGPLFDPAAGLGARQGVGVVPTLDFGRREGQVFPTVLVNEALQRQLGASVGEPILLNFRRAATAPQDTLLGSRDPEDTVGTLRLMLGGVVPDRGPGRFSLAPHQTLPLNAYLELPQLQRALDQEERVNGLMLSRRSEVVDANGGTAAPAASLVGRAITLDDLGLLTYPADGPGGGPALAIESRDFVIRPSVVAQIEDVAERLDAPVTRIQTYLANRMEVGDRVLPYSTVSALGAGGATPDPGSGPAAGAGQQVGPEQGDTIPGLRLVDGSPAPALADDEILLNEWAANDLEAEPGAPLRLSYYVVGPHEELLTDSSDFRVVGIVQMTGLAADADLTPDYPGIEGADNIAAWDPPFPVDLDLVRPADEEYWDRYAGTPKAFVAEETARRLWSTRYGSTTSVRLGIPEGELGPFDNRFRRELLASANLGQFGLRVLDVKAEGLEAARGATDFSGLFIGFSMFLIVSACLLVGLLFSLGVEQRAGEIGLRRSVGFPERRVRRQMLAEGGILAAIGAAVGLAGAVVYAGSMMLGLRTLWRSAVGSSQLFLHVVPGSLALGWAISVAVVLVSIWFTVRRLGRVPATALLEGSFFAATSRRRRSGRLTRRVAIASITLALALFAFAVATGRTTSPGTAMAIGSLLLIGGLAAFAAWCRGAHSGLERSGGTALWTMAARNSSWSPGRSILSVALVACACFVIVTVAANHRDPAAEATTIEAGGGGYELVATADVPIHHDLNRASARADLGFAEPSRELLDEVDVMPLRLLPGDDASCLNLYRPQLPAILGVPLRQRQRGGFEFAATIEERSNPWTLLEAELEPGVIPAFGDANSVQWILKLGLGQELEVPDQRGGSVRLRLVGLLSESIFQSQLLISEENFLRYFPEQSGYATFLVDTPDGRADDAAAALEGNLGEFGFDAVSTAEKVAGFLAVQNTYLSTFQLLGGLGLLLGTAGLGIVLARNVIERRAELATMRAFGYRRASLSRMVLAENLFLLLVGTLVGSGSAVLAVAPRYVVGAIELPWLSLGATLALVVAVGMLSSAAAVAGALRVPLLPVLKAGR